EVFLYLVWPKGRRSCLALGGQVQGLFEVQIHTRFRAPQQLHVPAHRHPADAIDGQLGLARLAVGLDKGRERVSIPGGARCALVGEQDHVVRLGRPRVRGAGVKREGDSKQATRKTNAHGILLLVLHWATTLFTELQMRVPDLSGFAAPADGEWTYRRLLSAL